MDVFKLTQEVESQQKELDDFLAFQKEHEAKQAELRQQDEKLEQEVEELKREGLVQGNQELEAKKEQLRDSEDQFKKFLSGKQESNDDYIANMIKDCQNGINNL